MVHEIVVHEARAMERVELNEWFGRKLHVLCEMMVRDVVDIDGQEPPTNGWVERAIVFHGVRCDAPPIEKKVHDVERCSTSEQFRRLPTEILFKSVV